MHPEDLATCVSCGLCLNDCPTYRVLGNEADSPRGRIQLIRTLVGEPGEPDPAVVSHLDACLVCRACETVCPSLVPFGRIMEAAREEISERRSPGGVAGTLRGAAVDIVTHRTLLRLLVALATLYDRTGLRAVLRRVLPPRLRAMESLLAPSEGRAYAPGA
ncbi:MAG: 4Fe-4S dicluster domain-containing protein, partial [Candidatus Limnocylindria bacterium]